LGRKSNSSVTKVGVHFGNVMLLVNSVLFVFRFLASGRSRETVVLVSYPRCGNSLARSLLESWSGIVTGSDTAPMRTLGASLLRCGFQVFLF
jgi:hypothetical protein